METVEYELDYPNAQDEPRLQRVLLIDRASKHDYDRKIIIDRVPLYGLKVAGWDYMPPTEFQEEFMDEGKLVDKTSTLCYNNE